MSRPPPAECPGCGQMTRRLWRMRGHQKIGYRYRPHAAPCGLPCKTKFEAAPGEMTHPIAEECLWCQAKSKRPSEPLPVAISEEGAPIPTRQPPEPKPPWDKIVIPPHALKMAKFRAGFESVIDAAMMIERLYPLAIYHSSQKKAKGTSHTKRTKPGKNKRKSQRVDLYTVSDEGVTWIFYMKRNVLMTIHRNDDLDWIGARPFTPVQIPDDENVDME